MVDMGVMNRYPCVPTVSMNWGVVASSGHSLTNRQHRKESMLMKTTTPNDLRPAEARAVAEGGLSRVVTVVNASSVGRRGDARSSLRRPEEKKL